MGRDDSESQWIEETLGGNPNSFSKLVHRYQDRVFNLCCRMLGDFEEARDCAQDAFIKAYRALDRFRGQCRFSTWLYSIALNTCKNHMKSAAHRRRKQMVSIDDPGVDGNPGPLARLEDTTPSPLAQLSALEQEFLVQKAIDSLPDEARSILLLRDLEGLSYEEIALVMDLPIGTVKSRLARARQQMVQKLKGVI